LASKLYENQGKAITNFDTTLPTSQIDSAIANNITRFLLELGSGFSYVGRQMELQISK
jgi:predicted nuclease of restriction endonuclease-like (RecB) superfamily